MEAEGCSFGTFFGYLFTEHVVLTVVGILVELVVIALAIKEVLHKRKEGAALRSARELLTRYASAVQMAKAIPAVEQNSALIAQLNDLGGYYQAWKKRWGRDD